LLEPADLPLLEGFLHDAADDAVHRQLARDVIGAIVLKNKKLWKDLKRFASATQPTLRLAGVRGSALALATDAEAFPRFAELAAPLVAVADDGLQAAIDEVLLAAAELHAAAAVAFAQQHQRRVAFPKPKPKAAPLPPAPAPAPTVSVKPAPQKTVKPAAKKPAAKKPSAAAKTAKTSNLRARS
jgi:outer membrane biosynthesis protein TonB